MTASSYVAWTVAGWLPGAACRSRRNRFHSTTGLAGRGAGAARLTAGRAARAAQAAAAMQSIRFIGITFGRGGATTAGSNATTGGSGSSGAATDDRGEAGEHRDQREHEHARLRRDERQVQRRLHGRAAAPGEPGGHRERGQPE